MRWIVPMFVWALVAVARVPAAPAAQDLQAVPDTVHLGTFNTFEEESCRVIIRNTSQYPLVIEKVTADCTCLRAKLSDKEIAAKSETTLELAVMQVTEGQFSHAVLVVPEDKEHHRPVRVQVQGRVVQPVIGAIGWSGQVPVACDPLRPTELGIVHQQAAKPVVYVCAKDDRFDVRASVIDVNSEHFELYDHVFISPSGSSGPGGGETEGKVWVVLRLRPKKPLKPGITREIMKISLAEDVRLDIQWTCRIVGGVYADEQRIALGSLASCRPRRLSVHFKDNHPRWKALRWTAVGQLSRAVTVEQIDGAADAHCIEFQVDVDTSKLAGISRGYVFCHVTLCADESVTEEGVCVLVDGFNG